jgi:transcriptional regulator with AAA-type ATPase domain
MEIKKLLLNQETFEISDVNTVVKNGLREGDPFELLCFQERKKELRLNRKSYLIVLGKKSEIDFLKCEIYIPHFRDSASRYSLELRELQIVIDGKIEKIARYLLTSLDHIPFNLNGCFVYSSFLERGDLVTIGLNKLSFKKEVLKNHNAQTDSMNGLSHEMLTSQLPILLEGETGTGKTRLAKQIHENSHRPGAFVHLNLSSFANSLIESEIFGHVKGAFTGAMQSKKGALCEAHKGTLFLDEIDSLSLDIQTKLLLFLDNFEFRTVGGESNKKVDVRLIVASGKNLWDLVQSGLMRRDFYFRIASGAHLKMPKLASNKALIKQVIEDFCHRETLVISEDLIQFYTECYWPGNIRQLINHLNKKKILSGGKKISISQEDYSLLNFVDEIQSNNEISTLDKIKNDYCQKVFLQLNRNVTVTSRSLGISPNTLKAILRTKSSLRNDNVINVNF